MKKEFKKGLKWLLIPFSAVMLAFVINAFFIINAIVPSGSMENTISEGTLVVGWRLAYKKSEIECGDIIFFKHKELGDNLIVKRVIAKAGQKVKITNGIVYINEQPLEEEYVSFSSNDSFDEVTVPEGSVFVLGDNRSASYDSRFWEAPFVSCNEILARACFSYFPKFSVY